MVGLGNLHLEEGNIKGAIELFKVARSLGSTIAMVDLGTLRGNQGEIKGAMQLWEEVRVFGSSVDGYTAATFNLACASAQLGDIRKAMHLYEELGSLGHADAFVELDRLNLHEKAMQLHDETQGQDKAGAVLDPSCIGKHVRIHGLLSRLGQSLNDLVGTICCFDHKAGRIGVAIDGVGKKMIKLENLESLDSLLAMSTATSSAANTASIQHALDDQDELSWNAQAAIEESVHDASAMQLFATVVANEKISETLRQARVVSEAGKYVVHLKLSRPCKALRDILLKSEELAPCRQLLDEAGFKVELESGVKIFVSPEHYEAVLVAIQGQKLHSKDVILSPGLERIVIQLVQGLSKRDKVYPRGSQTIPLGFLLEAQKEDLQVSFSKHFISIKVPSSLSCSSTAEGPKTV